MYSQAAAIQAAPTAISQGWLTMASASPASAPIVRLMIAAVNTARGVATREPTSRIGPLRTSSVPRIPSE
ncbi:hypothetical protein BN1047_01175 [Mycolicibacterium neoaurum]|uniref:Uncharacterized protein n=1 Tax=Mycolicibacterium neoaurum TaxID=1795 RepID=A0AAV2WGH1_MYCNE|nr:hypothetical protein BN1047_01175 [Mycolicibacterium neoaurum]